MACSTLTTNFMFLHGILVTLWRYQIDSWHSAAEICVLQWRHFMCKPLYFHQSAIWLVVQRVINGILNFIQSISKMFYDFLKYHRQKCLETSSTFLQSGECFPSIYDCVLHYFSQHVNHWLVQPDSVYSSPGTIFVFGQSGWCLPSLIWNTHIARTRQCTDGM